MILADESLNEDVKGQLLSLLKTPTFGLVWEEKTEDVVERLREELPILKEDKSKAIISDDPEAPNHVLIEADNLDALVALTYTHAEKFDAIYIDPPYNSGATDWRYNNDYVDREDSYRHSKWLCMMEHRLRIAKRLLNPENSVLIVTIDEKEYHHLGCLLESIFPNGKMQMVSTVINNKGVARDDFFRVNEYIYFIRIGSSAPVPLALSDEWHGNIRTSTTKKVRWGSLMRSGSNAERKHSPGCFYPIFISADKKHFCNVGDALPLDMDKAEIIVPDGQIALFPIHDNGTEGCWQYSRARFCEIVAKGYARISTQTKNEASIRYISEGWQRKVEDGTIKVIGKQEDGSLIFDDEEYVQEFIPGNQWAIHSHDATEFGSKMLRDMFGDKVFSYPKSLFAVEDSLRFFVINNKKAKILDFFAGSGTTLHATMELNQEDGGHRQCILVTNNENNICEEVTYERNKRVIQGYTTPKGENVEGLTSNSLRYYRVEHTPRKHTHENKMLLAQAMTEMLQIKWNAYKEPDRFGTIRVKPKYMRYFEGDEDVLIIYVPEIIPYIVKEFKTMPEGKKLHIYVVADGNYAYSEEFTEVAKRIELAAIPSVYYNAIKSILPAPTEETSDYVPAAEDEDIIAQADINDYQD